MWSATALLAIVAIMRHIVVTRRKRRELLEQDLAEDQARQKPDWGSGEPA